MLGYRSRQSRDICLFNSANGIEQGFIMPNFRGEKVNAETRAIKGTGGGT